MEGRANPRDSGIDARNGLLPDESAAMVLRSKMPDRFYAERPTSFLSVSAYLPKARTDRTPAANTMAKAVKYSSGELLKLIVAPFKQMSDGLNGKDAPDVLTQASSSSRPAGLYFS